MGRGAEKKKAHRCAVSRGLASRRGEEPSAARWGEETGGREEGSVWRRTLAAEGRKRVKW